MRWPKRFGIVMALILAPGLSLDTVSRAVAAPTPAGFYLTGNSAALSRLPARLAEAVERSLVPAGVPDSDEFAQQQELVASDGASADFFAFSVALSNDGHIALIGAQGKNTFKGAAYIFAKHGDTWTQQQELAASDGAPGDSFGVAVALSNDGHIALIGAGGKNSSQGAAYIFTEDDNTFTQQQELVASDGAPGDGFGFAMALSNDGHIALIGAGSKNSSQGAAYIFSEQ